MKFSENLRRLRKERGYSQEYLAERLNVTRQTISKWENATAMPDLKKITETAELFGVSMDELLGIEAGFKVDTARTEYNNQYHDLKISQQEKKTNNLIIIVVILSVLLVASAFFIAVLTANQSRMFSSLQSEISALRTQYSSITINNTDDYDDTSYCYDANAAVVGYNKDNPKLVDIELTYQPDSYPKDAEIYFIVNDKDNGTRRVDAENKNNIFTATTQFDITAQADSFQVCIDDGKTVTPLNFDVYLPEEYCNINDISLDYSYNNSIFGTGCFENYFIEPDIYVNYIFDSPLKSAALVVMFGDESKKEINLDIQKNNDTDLAGNSYTLSSNELYGFQSNTAPMYVDAVLTLEDSTVIRFYYDQGGGVAMGDESQSVTLSNYTFNVTLPDGTVIDFN